MLTFDRIAEGDDFGVTRVDARSAGDVYRRVFSSPTRENSLPAGLMVALLMSGYLALVADRPPGNVHAAQALRWGPPAAIDAELSVSLRCLDKEVRKGRRWLRFEARLFSASATHLVAVNSSIWGA